MFYYGILYFIMLYYIILYYIRFLFYYIILYIHMYKHVYACVYIYIHIYIYTFKNHQTPITNICLMQRPLPCQEKPYQVQAVFSVRLWRRYHDFMGQYCGWKKSCITLDGRNPINNGTNYLSTGAGILPSTVVRINMAQNGKEATIERLMDNDGSMDWFKSLDFIFNSGKSAHCLSGTSMQMIANVSSNGPVWTQMFKHSSHK